MVVILICSLGDASKITPFTIGFLIIGAGYHMTAVSNSSLVSKSLSTEAQGKLIKK
jgi:hypothetical protein